MRIQDSLDVCACHGMAGTWGAIATGIFASHSINSSVPDGVIHGQWHLLGAQLISVAAVWFFTFVMSYLIARIVDKLLHFTVTEEQQQRGLDSLHYGFDANEETEAAAAA